MKPSSLGARSSWLLCALFAASSATFAPPALAAGEVGVKIFEQSSDGRHYALYVGVSTAAAAVVLCEGVTVDRCDAATQGAHKTRLAANRADRRIFQTEYALDLRDGTQYAVVGLDASGKKTDTLLMKVQAATPGQPQPGGQQPPPPPPPSDGSRVKLEALTFSIPSGWKVYQDAQARGMLILGLTDGNDYLRIYVKQGGGFDMQKTFVNESTVTKASYTAQHGGRSWTKMETKKGAVSVACFSLELNGHTYWGFATSSNSAPSAVIDALLESTR